MHHNGHYAEFSSEQNPSTNALTTHFSDSLYCLLVFKSVLTKRPSTINVHFHK